MIWKLWPSGQNCGLCHVTAGAASTRHVPSLVGTQVLTALLCGRGPLSWEWWQPPPYPMAYWGPVSGKGLASSPALPGWVSVRMEASLLLAEEMRAPSGHRKGLPDFQSSCWSNLGKGPGVCKTLEDLKTDRIWGVLLLLMDRPISSWWRMNDFIPKIRQLEWNSFLQSCKSPKLTQQQAENLNRPRIN